MNCNATTSPNATEPDCVKEKITAEDVVLWLRLADDPNNQIEHLREMIDAFFLYHEDLTHEQKSTVYSTYTTIVYALKKVKCIQKQISVN